MQGQIFTNPDLARTYDLIAADGRDAYYKGAIAQTIDALLQTHRRRPALRGLRGAHRQLGRSRRRELSRLRRLYELPPNTQGIAALQMLKMLEGFDLKKMGRGSADALHVMVEAKRLAFEDLAKFYADPATYNAPIDQLISDSYAAQRRALIDMTHANPNVAARRRQAAARATRPISPPPTKTA